ncbi:MAG TPA: MMPL family transporter [Nitriliruptorales bacterium]
MKLPLPVAHPWPVVVVAIIAFAVAGIIGGDVAESLSSGGFDDPLAQSTRAREVLDATFGSGDPAMVLLIDGRGTAVDDPGVRAAAEQVLADLSAEEGVLGLASYWSLGSPPPLKSVGGDKALAFVRLDGEQSVQLDRAGVLADNYRGEHGPIEVGVGGVSATFAEVNQVIEEDLVTAELIALPLTLILLVVIFGSVVAALLPLGIGGLAIIGTFFALEVVASFTEVSIFALNFTTAMGFGLAIDYALLVVSRYREELAHGFDVETAVTRTVRTAGRTVVFSALTVASSLAALLVFRFAFLRSFAYAGIAVVGLAAVGAVVILPAVLRLLGHRVNNLKVRTVRPKPEGAGFWHTVAVEVMRRPFHVSLIVIIFLANLGVPFLDLKLGFPDDRVLPPSAETRTVGDTIRAEFASSEQSAVTVVAPDVGDTDARLDEVDAYATRLSTLERVARVDAPTGSYVGGLQVVGASPISTRFVTGDAVWLSVVPSVEPISPEGEELVRDVRALDAPFDGVLVGGGPAELLDGRDGLVDQLPLGLGLIAVITFVVLFLQFGSVLVPLKAIVLNLFSLSATFGAMVWIFQDGHLSGVLDFTATGTIVTTMPVLMFCIAFGLSMDYEVFLLSRIKEEFDRTGDNEASIAAGLEHTGRIVTAAAVLIAVVFAAFATGRVSFMKMFGIGLALAVLADAFLIRATLVPAFMKLAGGANWWAPGPLRRLHDRLGVSEHVDLGPEPGG